VSLVLREVRYRYAGSARPALDGIDLTLEPGTVLGIVGANEAGKSTLCLVAAGLAPATIGGRLEGTVTIDDLATSSSRPHDLAQRCGILFQNPATQLSGTAATVWEEVAFALAALRIDHLADRDPQRLSGGQAQLVALAGVLVLRPRYLVLDEPTSQLDPLGTRLVGDALAGLVAATGAGILVVEHKTDLLAGLAGLAGLAATIAVLAGGRVALSGPAADVLADDALEEFGVEPPSRVRLERAARHAGVALPATV